MTLTRKERITVIVTTHYIEEARQANVVGLMRQGRLLAENSPDQLMADHALDTLEDVFLKLCMSDMSLKAASLAGYTGTNNGSLPPNLQQTAQQLPPVSSTNKAGLTNGSVVTITTNGHGPVVNGHHPLTSIDHGQHPPPPPPPITSEQYKQIATNGDLRNIIKVF